MATQGLSRATRAHRGRSPPAPDRAAGARGRARALPRRDREGAGGDPGHGPQRVAHAGRRHEPHTTQEAEARGARLLEEARHPATELTNSARAEVEHTLEWARAQATAIVARAQDGAEQLLSAAGLGDDAIAEVSRAIVRAAEEAIEASRQTGSAARRGDRPALAATENDGDELELPELPVSTRKPPSADVSEDEDDGG